MSRVGLVLAWTLTRLATLVMLFAYEGVRGVTGDVTYFSRALHAVPMEGLAHTLVEYPLPAVGVAAVPYGVAALLGDVSLFGLLLVLLLLVVDGVFTLLVRRSTTERLPVLFWLAAVPLLGSISLARIDLLVGAVAAVGLLVVARRPVVAGVLVAVATGLKLWPVLLVPAVVAATSRRRTLLLAGSGTGLALAVGTTVLAGWSRAWSPLTYQSGRGLQVESMLGGPAMLGWAVRPNRWDVSYAPSRSYEVTGPGVAALLVASTVLTIALVLAFGALSVRVVSRRGGLSAEGAVWCALAAVLGFLVSAKVLSPQYLLWLAPLVVVGLIVTSSRAMRLAAVVVLAVLTLTHLVYPLLYVGLVRHSGQTAAVVPILLVRNLLIVGLLVHVGRQAWRSTSTL